jgi:2'-5' RNA ligase
MLDFNIPNWFKLRDYAKILDVDLLERGLESQPHCTILYGFDESVNPTALVKILPRANEYAFKITGIGCFENPDAHVLYFALNCPLVNTINHALATFFPVENPYPEYIPHMTIGYFKPNCALKYKDKIKYQINSTIIPVNYRYSYPSGVEFIF